MQARGELPLTCKVRLPAVVHNDGTTSPAMEVKVKSCLDPKENVMIELKAETLEHLRFVMLHSEQPASRKRPPSGAFHGVRFRAERKGFLATRKQGGKETYKTFKVADDADELERAEIAERAQRWVEGGNISDQEGDGSADVKSKSSETQWPPESDLEQPVLEQPVLEQRPDLGGAWCLIAAAGVLHHILCLLFVLGSAGARPRLR